LKLTAGAGIPRALKASNVAGNLFQRESECYGPRTVLLTDITYTPYNGTFTYLSTILDAYTKQFLSYVLSSSLGMDSVLEAVEKPIRDHGVSPTQWTVIHSGQGVHYTSHRFIEITKNKNLGQSMSRRGNCWDNAPQESFLCVRSIGIRKSICPMIRIRKNNCPKKRRPPTTPMNPSMLKIP